MDKPRNEKLIFSPLTIPNLDMLLATLPQQGKLLAFDNNYCFLDIDNNYINQIYPLLPNNSTISKPNYFSAEKNFIGAHISVIYNEEILAPLDVKLFQSALGQTYSFKVERAGIMAMGNNRYYVLKISAPALSQLRQQLNLPELLCYKDYLVDFHITVGVKLITNS